MPAKAEVILRYGPYSAVGLAVEHRTFRLEGLQAVLAKGGHKVVLEKIEEWNVVELMVNEDVVFQCTITDLEFAFFSTWQMVNLSLSGPGWPTQVRTGPVWKQSPHPWTPSPMIPGETLKLFF
ncbi:UPF0728 protein C10orf53 homolog isoform X3 [Heterocephalus glaber]|uniref:UPF0728 protein C10orf53 homolog isoform X3 n=1 Tax=Heterocephalus glaber TaxID=10181 RepID=A0AAX6SEM2_HETGA|nr:UPF0728 protein C10orf53 homolog isoform X3 [Heterocephalus glaber]